MLFVGLIVFGFVVLRMASVFVYCSALKKEIIRARAMYEKVVTAQVTKVEMERVDRSSALFWPVFRYEADGRVYEKQGLVFSKNPLDYQEGWYFEIRYNADDPGEFMLLDDEPIYRMAETVSREFFMAIIVGGGLALFAAASRQ